MPRKLAGFALAVCIIALFVCAVPGLAQTATELLQKGIYAQETEGNLDNAILIYRQIVNSAPSQRDLAAQAQYRLAQAQLQKGDLANASAEFNKLARDYADYQKLVSELAAQANRSAGPGGRGGPPVLNALATTNFDENRPVTARGKVSMLTLMNPLSMIAVDGESGDRFLFALASANDMIAQDFRRTSLKPGDEVTVTGVLAKGDQKLEGKTPALASTITGPDGKVLFNRAAAASTNAQTDGLKARLAGTVAEISAAERNLFELRQQFTDSNPEVQMALKQLEMLRVARNMLIQQAGAAPRVK